MELIHTQFPQDNADIVDFDQGFSESPKYKSIIATTNKRLERQVRQVRLEKQ